MCMGYACVCGVFALYVGVVCVHCVCALYVCVVCACVCGYKFIWLAIETMEVYSLELNR